jgi:hypothetical protein
MKKLKMAGVGLGSTVCMRIYDSKIIKAIIDGA